MSPRLALWFLWTALSLCLPAAARLELCLCDGPRGLLDGTACGMQGEDEVQSCCCAPDGSGEPRLDARGEEGDCRCLSIDVQRSEPALHAVVVPATPLRAEAVGHLVHVAPAPRRECRALVRRAWVRARLPDGVPLRI
jgi:hypothetical protein